MRARTLALPALVALFTLAACGDPVTATSDTVVTVDVTTSDAADTAADGTTTTATSADTTGSDTSDPATTLVITATLPPETPAGAAIVAVSGAVDATLTGASGPVTGSLATTQGASWHLELRPTGGATLVELDATGQPVTRAAPQGVANDIPVTVARWGPAEGQAAPEVAFLVAVPEGTATDTGIWISGDVAALGAWDGAGVRLAATRDGRWAAVVAFESGVSIAYKVTRGSWETVEKAADGGELDNRLLEVNVPMTRPEIIVQRWRDQAVGPPTGTGDIEVIPGVASTHLEPDRDVIVWLPPGYDAETTRRYPVLYMHDGQNLMDASTSAFGTEWGVDETAQALVTAGDVAPLIIVGVYNTGDRIAEYTPTVDASYGDGGKADAYGAFLAEELKPMIDARYRTETGPDATGLAGSSLGGLVSLYLGLERPETFRRLGVVSPSVWWDERDIVDRVTALEAKLPLRVWLDIGSAEGGGESVEDTRLLRDALVGEGWVVGADLGYGEYEGAAHNEAAWAARFDDILRWLYPAE